MAKTSPPAKSDDIHIIDVKRASDVAPAPTSKPIVVSNKPMIDADPMIAKAAEAAAQFRNDAKEKTPPEETDPATDAVPSAPLIMRHRGGMVSKPGSEDQQETERGDRMGVTPASGESKPATPPSNLRQDEANASSDEKQDNPNTKGIDNPDSAEHEDTPADSSTQDDELDPAHKTATIPEASADKPTEPDDDSESHIKITQPASKKKIMPISQPTVTGESATSTTSEPALSEANDDQKPEGGDTKEPHDSDNKAKRSDSAANPSEDKRSLELEAIIASGRYYLPINAHRHYRKRVLFVSLFVLLLVGMLLNVMLDVGMVAIPGIPHTTFFTAR